MYLPSCVVTVIAALPNPTAVIVPLLSTVATFVSLEVQATHLSVAYSGNTVGIRVSVSSINKVVECLFRSNVAKSEQNLTKFQKIYMYTCIHI